VLIILLNYADELFIAQSYMIDLANDSHKLFLSYALVLVGIDSHQMLQYFVFKVNYR